MVVHAFQRDILTRVGRAVLNVIRLVMRKTYPESKLRVEFEAVGNKYFVGEISENLLTQNFANWKEQQTRGSILPLPVLRKGILLLHTVLQPLVGFGPQVYYHQYQLLY